MFEGICFFSKDDKLHKRNIKNHKHGVSFFPQRWTCSIEDNNK